MQRWTCWLTSILVNSTVVRVCSCCRHPMQVCGAGAKEGRRAVSVREVGALESCIPFAPGAVAAHKLPACCACAAAGGGGNDGLHLASGPASGGAQSPKKGLLCVPGFVTTGRPSQSQMVPLSSCRNRAATGHWPWQARLMRPHPADFLFGPHFDPKYTGSRGQNAS